MPLDATNMVANGHLIHQDIHQFVDLLTGVMADQPVVIANRLTVGGDLRFTPDITYDIGPSTFRPRSMYLGSFVQQGEIATPTPPPAGQMKIYPKSDGNYYKLDSAGVEQQIGAGGAGGGALEEDFLPPNGTNTVTVSQTPVAIWTVTRDGLTQTTSGGDWNVAGRVLTFSDPFNGSERVTVLYAISAVGGAGPAGPAGPSSSVHEEFLPAAAATTVALSQTPLAILMCSRAGVVQSAADGNYSLAGNTITFTDPLNGAERVVVDYSSTSYMPALPLNGTGISDGTVTNAKLSSDTARANLLTNGGFEQWQRGVGPFSSTNAFTGLMSADRWQCGPSTAGTISISADTTNQDVGSRVCAQVNISGTNTPANGALMYQNFVSNGEVVDFRGRLVSFSLRVRASVPNAVRIAINDVQGGSRPMSAYHSGSGLYETLRVTLPAPISNTCINGQVNILFDANGQFFVDNAMLVVGSVAADYAPLHPADDLARCFRYYELLGVTGGAWLAMGQAYAAANSVFVLRWKAQKAVVPTVTFSAASNYWVTGSTANNVPGTSMGTNGPTTVESCGITVIVASGLVAGNACILLPNVQNAPIVVEANP